jgi:xanthine dehydrogenase small subunit
MDANPGVTTSLRFWLNGKPVDLTQVSPSQTLLEYLRWAGHVGTKEGCGDGDCGACTVAMIRPDADGKPHYTAVNSCLIPLGSVAQHRVVTVEAVAGCRVPNAAGVEPEQLHPVQAAMVETGGSQCGYCTPGFIMSLFAAYYNGAVDDLAVEGNLCRCTGYLSIRRAAQQIVATAPAVLEDAFAAALTTVEAEWSDWHYDGAGQLFYRPSSLAAVYRLLDQQPKATLLAGGTDLGLEMSHHRQPFPVLISLEAVTELQGVSVTADGVDIGAAVPLSQIEATVSGLFPALDEMLHWFAARQVRNRATLGGNIGTASPIGDLPPVLLALDATVRLTSAQGERWLPLADFFLGYRQTALQPGEVIATVRIPRAIAPTAHQRLSQSYKIGKRGTDDISIVAAAFAVDLDAEQRIVQARLAYGGVAATPVRAIAVEQQLLGQPWTHATVQSVKPALRQAFTPLSDLRGSADYRRLLVANLFEKFFVEMRP